MKSRTSFFNPVVLRKDITRFLPVWLIYLIGSLLIGVNNISGIYSQGTGEAAWELVQSITGFGALNFIYAFICAQMLFGDLFKSRLCNALHAMPIRREGWFVTHTIAGIAFSLVPNFILCLCYMPMMDGMWYISLLWLLAVTLEYIFFFGLAAFSAICAGNRFGMTTIYVIANFLSLIVSWFVSNFYEPHLHGLHLRYEISELLCPLSCLSNLYDLVIFKVTERTGDYFIERYYTYQSLSPDWWYPEVLAVVGIGLLALGLLLYRKRKLECAGDLIAFPIMKPIFSVIFTLCCGVVSQIFGDNEQYLIAGIVIGYFVCQMLMQRTVKVFRKGAFIKCATICVTLLVSILLTMWDPLGITRWVPQPEQVDSVILSGSYYFELSEWDKANPVNSRIIENPDAIKELTEVHRQVMAETISDNYGSYEAIHLTYRMKDGRIIERRYFYHRNGAAGKLMDRIVKSPEYILGYRDWNEFLDRIDGAYLGWDYDELMPREAAVSLAEAVKADCDSGHMTQTDSLKYAGTLTLTFDGDTELSLDYYTYSYHILNWIETYAQANE